MKHFVVLANGPGELWGWSRPVVKVLKDAGNRVDLLLLPCQYASGSETKLAGRLGADRVVPSASLTVELAFGKARPDAILQLGGDLLYGKLLARRWGSPLFSYSYGPKKGLSACRGVFTACEAMAKPIRNAAPGKPVEVVGNLVADAMEMDVGAPPWGKKGSLRAALFPGSRPAIRKKALSFMGEFLASARKHLPQAEWSVLLSPFCEPQELRGWEKAGFTVSLAGTGVALRGADVALTQPGTNTLELLHARVPSIVAVPEAFLADAPSPLLLEPLFALPGFGPFLKRRAFRRYLEKKGFLAWPNRLAGREIFPEITGQVSPTLLAGRFAAYAGNPGWLEATRNALGRIDTGPAGAAERLKERIMEALS
jgi:lipid-A-disaccharide synthase